MPLKAQLCIHSSTTIMLNIFFSDYIIIEIIVILSTAGHSWPCRMIIPDGAEISGNQRRTEH